MVVVGIHELGHDFGLCDEYDTCVWESQNAAYSCPNSKPNAINSNCGNYCCDYTGHACCYGKYADTQSDNYYNVMGSANMHPPERRLSTESKNLIDSYLCNNFQIC